MKRRALLRSGTLLAFVVTAAFWQNPVDPVAASNSGFFLVKVVDNSEEAPGTGGLGFTTFYNPFLNDSGDVVFEGSYDLGGGALDKGIFLRTSQGLEAVVIEGDAAPAAVGGTFGESSYPVVNDTQQVAFRAAISGGSTSSGIFMWDAGAMTKVVALGDVLPSIGTVDGLGGSCGYGVAINSSGHVAFQAVDYIYPRERNGIAVYTGTGFDIPVVQDPFSGSSIHTFEINREGLNGTDDVAYWAAGGSAPGVAIRTNAGAVAVGTGDTAPGTGGGTFGDFGAGALCSEIGVGPAFNDSADVAFFDDSISGGTVTHGLFYHPFGGATQAVALPGQVAPDTGGGTFGGFYGRPSLNNAGAVAFRASTSAGEGMFVWSGGSAGLVAQDGDPAPDTGGGTLDTLPGDYPVINEQGAIVFRANIVGGSAGSGVFLALPNKGDQDGDGLSNGDENNTHGTDPLDDDTDGDGMSDGEEVGAGCGLDPLTDDAAADQDSDGLANLSEFGLGTDPCDDDTDNDVLGDGDEIDTYGTDPTDPDTDGDLCEDGVEELGLDESVGGLRDAINPWDFYEVLGPAASLPPDGVIDLPNDILGVILHFSPQGAPPYDANFDRGPSSGPNAWNMTAPDGVIDLPNDILGVILQFNHDCR